MRVCRLFVCGGLLLAAWLPSASSSAAAADRAAALRLTEVVDEGYLDAYATESGGEVSIIRGPRYRIGAVYVNDSARSFGVGSVATADVIRRVIERTVARLQSEGYYFARAALTAVNKTASDVTLRITAAPGPKVQVGRLVIEGLTRSDQRQVRRYLALDTAMVVTDALVEDLARRADGVDYLTFLPPVQLQVRPGYTEADLLARFREKQQVRIAGGGGYAPDDDAGLVWHLDLALTNLFGGGRSVGVRSARPDRGRTMLNIDYSQPVFLLGMDRLALNVATRNFEDDFYEFGFAGEYRTYLTPEFNLSLRPGWRRVEPEGPTAGYSAYRIGLGAERSTLDQPLNPAAGYRLETAVDYVYRRYSEDTLTAGANRASYNETRTRLGVELYQRLVGQVVGAISVTYEGYESEQEQPSLAELILVGGPGSIRGYRNEQFAVRRTAYGTIEPRYRFTNGYAFVFYDAAYLNRTIAGPDGPTTDERFEWGTGFGLSLTQDGRSLTVSFGWGKESALDEPRLSIDLRSGL